MVLFVLPLSFLDPMLMLTFMLAMVKLMFVVVRIGDVNADVHVDVVVGVVVDVVVDVSDVGVGVHVDAI